MATTSVSMIFLLLNLVLLVSAEEQRVQSCPPTFQCGTLGVLRYPFTTFFNPDCGVSVLNCTEPTQIIGLTSAGPWYDVMNSFSRNKTFLVGDKELLHVLYSDNCEMFDHNISLPRSPSVSFTILHNETLWKCPRNFDVSVGNRSGTLRNIKSCEGYNLYDNNFRADDIPGCSVFPYPRFVMVELSDKCSQCVNEAGLCKDLTNGGFRCINKNKARRKFRLVLGLGIAGGSIFIIVLGVVLWRIRMIKLGSMALSSRDVSPDQYTRMRTDLEKSKVYFSVPVFSYCELEEATNNFDPSRELGDGGYGTVYYGKLKDGREVAVKRLYQRNCRRLQLFMNEIEILAGLRHQNLVSLYGCTSTHGTELLLVYEYVPNGTVADQLYGEQAKCGILTWPIRMSIAIETARALSYLHASDIIHRDVKSNNILLDNNFTVKVADFGLSRLFPVHVTHISTAPQGTPGYLDPEYHQCYQLTDKSDVYSFGVLLVELISSLPAIDISRKQEEINLSYYAMKRIRGCEFDELVDHRLGSKTNYKTKRMITSVAELAFQCLQHRKEFRPSMAEVLEALERIEGADYEVHKAEKTDENDVKAQTEADHVWLHQMQ